MLSALIFALFHSENSVYTALFIFVTATLCYLYKIIGDSRVFDMNGKRIPGPDSNFSKESFRAVVKARMNKSFSLSLKEIFLDKTGNGSIAAAKVFGRCIVSIAHPDMMKTVMMGNHNQFPKDVMYNRLSFIFGDGIFVSRGEKWQRQRHLINVGFHAEVLKRMTTVFKRLTFDMISSWHEKLSAAESTGVAIDMNHDVNLLTLNIICETAFTYKFNPAEYDFAVEINLVLDEANRRILDPTDWSWRLSPTRSATVKGCVAKINTVINGVIDDRRALYKEEERRAAKENRAVDIKVCHPIESVRPSIPLLY